MPTVEFFIDNKFIDGNEALFKMTGYTEEEYRNLRNEDVTPALYDEAEMNNFKSLAETARYGPYEKEYIHKNGHSVPILLHGIKFTGDNGEEQVYSVIQDISARKQAEKQRHPKTKKHVSTSFATVPAAKCREILE